MNDRRSTAQRSLDLTGLFEADVLVWLLLRQWNHPLAEDEEWRQNLLESAAEALRASIDGDRLFDDIAPADVNLVAALWYVEWITLNSNPEIGKAESSARATWLETVRRALPSCFCDPGLLP